MHLLSRRSVAARLPACPVLTQYQYARPVDPVSGQVSQRAVGLVEAVRSSGDLNRQPLCQGEELGGVATGVGRDAAQIPLLEQVLVVVERRDIGQVDARDGTGTASVEGGQSGGDNVADRSED